VGHGRSALSTARLPLSHVGTAGNQGPGAVASSDAAQRRILWCRAVAGWKFGFSRETGKFNALTFLAFLKRLRRTSIPAGHRVVVITDNAKYHHARLHKEWRENHAEDFALEYLPPYSPELNPIERVWKLTRRQCIHNRYFPTLEEVVTTVEAQFGLWARGNETLRRLCAIT